ncbi:MAG: S9 family peptidase [Acidimicrobiia bacterium]|nr:S9 family peptidase [Acidimicrobiia bacterium]
MTRAINPHDLWAMARIGPPVASSSGSVVLAPVTTHDEVSGEPNTRLYDVLRSRYVTSDAGATSPAVRPDGGAVAFLRKVDEYSQVHVLDLTGGEATCLTDLPLGARAMKWLPDGTALIVVAKVVSTAPDLAGTREVVASRKDIKHTARVTERKSYRHWDTWFTDDEVSHLFLVDLTGVDPVDLTPDLDANFGLPASTEPAALFDISPDGASIVFCAAPRDHGELPRPRYRLFSSATDGSGMIELTPDNPGDDGEPRFTPDGQSVVFGAQRLLDFYADPVRLTRLDLASGDQTELCPGWQLSPSAWEMSATGLVVAAEDRGRTALFSVPLGGGSPTELARDCSLGSPFPTPAGIFALRQSLSFPPEIVRIVDGTTEVLTHLNDEVMAGLDLGVVEEIEVSGADDRPIQTFVVFPPGFDPDRQWPLVHMIHGGPHGTFGDVWHFRWNAHVFAAPGYVVPLVNFHGSTSFGHDFTSSISGEWGDKPTTDVLAATDDLIARGFVDTDRMAITGGSYGGYLTAWLATQTDRFACAIAHAAVTNLSGMYASDWTTGLARGSGAAPWEDPERAARWSPSHHYAGYATPTLVIHGERDYRVPITQGLELYGILKAKGVDARLVYYPDENHWILKKHNSLHWYDEVHTWLARFLS